MPRRDKPARAKRGEAAESAPPASSADPGSSSTGAPSTGLLARRWELAAYGSLILTAAVMRLWDLGSRAMHHDESLHAMYSWYLSTGLGYRHEPMMHGPLQMEATAGAFFLFGDGEFTARVIYAVAGTLLVGLPFLFRARLGTLGALFVSVMLAFSPAMLYFSRFARNDILMAVWTLGLVICMWRYIDEGRNRYLYIASSLLALALATKETAFIVVATLGLYLVLVVTYRNWESIRAGVTIGEVSPPVALVRLAAGAWSTLTRALKLSKLSRPAVFLLLLVTLSLPQWSALVSVVQDTGLVAWSGLVLASPVGGPGPIGAPVRGGLVLAFLVVGALLIISAMVGERWRKSTWWRCAGIFYAVWIPLYTTFFTNFAGLGSGVWQSLGYWLVQQGEARGGQPWFYYVLITSIYEFLPLILAVVGGVYYIRRRDPFGSFLVFWAATTFVLYTIASEKMPWLLVNVALPMIVLGGRFLGEAVERVQWRRLTSGGGLLLLPGIPLFVVALWQVAFVSLDGEGTEPITAAVSVVVVLALAASAYFVARRVGGSNFASFALVPVVLILLAITVRAGWRASYENGDIPVEMLVYTQTTPDIALLADHVKDVAGVASASGDPKGASMAIDGTSGFTWPWAWYLRGKEGIQYPSFSDGLADAAVDSSVVLVHSTNYAKTDPVLVEGERYTSGVRMKHRWWFPETYRGLTPGTFLGALVDRKAWRNAMDYFLHRKLKTPLGSEDVYLYFSGDFPSSFTPTQ